MELHMKVYALKKDKNTDELHLFEGIMTEANKCNIGAMSVCKGMNKSESESNIFACQSESVVRIECAKIGRGVCGVCVSHLYTTY
jgi:hypothetical protein